MIKLSNLNPGDMFHVFKSSQLIPDGIPIHKDEPFVLLKKDKQYSTCQCRIGRVLFIDEDEIVKHHVVT